MKHDPSPAREIAHFVAKILAARQTKNEDIPQLVASVRDTIDALRAASTEPGIDRSPARQMPQPAAAAPSAPRRRRTVVIKPTERRARRPEPEPIAPAVPRLMRRAEVAPAPEPPPFEMRSPQTGTLRGVVRWFDLNTRQGTLRLPGFGDEVVIDGAVLERAGIPRLYKGQEIEARVADDGGGVRLVSLALPGRVESNAHGVFKAGAPRRNAKPVVVELKRDAMRRTAARIEAEHILGSGRDGAN